MITPLPCIVFLDADGLFVLKEAIAELVEESWSSQEETEGRSVLANCDANNWPHFKAYFEQLGWDVTAEYVEKHSGYVEHAIIKPKVPVPSKRKRNCNCY